MAEILSSSFRSPRVYGILSIPLITDPTTNSLDYTKVGSQLVLDQIQTIRRISILDPGSDTLDGLIQDDEGTLSPITGDSNFGRFFFPGVVDNKLQIYMGMNDGAAESLLPKGVYIVQSFNQDNELSSNAVTLSCLDQWMMFQGTVNTQFPPRLYGNQVSAYFNPNYNLVPVNASGGTATIWACDAVHWMQSGNDNVVWATDFVAPTVYCSLDSSGTTPTPRSLTIDYANGTVTFATAIPTTAVVSVDARPLGMAPEKMLQHLFSDFGNFSTASMQFDPTGIILPVTDMFTDRSILDIAKDIVFATAVRGLRWRIYFNENGTLIFTEDCCDGPPVKTLVDTYDIIKYTPEYTAKDIKNVIRAQARCITDQPLTVISLNVLSISIFTQSPVFDVPTDLLSTVVSMDPGSALAYLNGLTSSLLFEYSYPTISAEVEIVPDPSLQVNDTIWIKSSATGTDKAFIIQQITEEASAESYSQTLRVEQFKGTQDYSFGLGAYVGAPNPANPQNIQAASGLISNVNINGVNVVNNGQPVTDNSYLPVLPTWDGHSALGISITVATPPAGGTGYIWRWMYLGEDAIFNGNILTGSLDQSGVYPSQAPPGSSLTTILENLFGHYPATHTLPYSVQQNTDTPRSRKYYRPLLRCTDWLTGDGTPAWTSLSTFNSSWNGGIGVSNPYLYGNLKVGISDFYGNTTSGFSGASLYAAGTPAATLLGASTTTKYGVDFGVPTSELIYYAIKRKMTPAYLCILVANTAGSCQFKRIPFWVSM